MKLGFCRQIFIKFSDIKFRQNPFSGSRVVPCWQTDRHDEANNRSSQFPKVPNRSFTFIQVVENVTLRRLVFTEVSQYCIFLILSVFRHLRFLARLRSCKKRLWASSCLSVRPSIRLSAWNTSSHTRRILMKFIFELFFENLSRKFRFY